MLRKLGWVLVGLSVTIPAWCAERPGAISGYVRSAGGTPQMGAVVEVLGIAAHNLKIFTDENGFYSATGIEPGVYSVKVSAPSFLPALRERVGLRAGAGTILNVTLSTLFEAIQMAPAQGQGGDDDWKWVLRSSADRPILRILPDGSPAVITGPEGYDHEVRGSLSFVAGSTSQGYGGGGDMSTGFVLEKSVFSAGKLAFSGSVGSDQLSPQTVLRASYQHKLANGSEPEIGFTLRRFSPTDRELRDAALQALSVTTSDRVVLGDVVELKFGSELQTIQFMGTASAFRPFGTADVHLSPNTVVEYSYTTSRPSDRFDARSGEQFASAPGDLSETGPRVSLASNSSSVERAHHHELSLSQHAGKTSMQLALYSDRIVDPALTGVGETSAGDGEVLPDNYSGTYTYQGRDLDTRGLRVVLQRKLAADLTATLDYGVGGVLDLRNDETNLDRARESMTTRQRHALSAKVNGTLASTKTHWGASYGWVSGRALTPVDMFNASPGQTEPYLSFFLRQPLPNPGSLSGHMEALLEVRNLLAQGYVPLLGNDGNTVYLVQSARSIRGGIAFTF